MFGVRLGKVGVRASLLVLRGQIGDELRKGFHLGLVDELELGDEVVEVLEAGVKVSLLSERDDAVEVAVVDVRVDSEKALEDRLDNGLESLRERHIGVRREDIFVVKLRLHPRHQILDVFRGGAFDRFFDLLAVHPQVFIPAPMQTMR